MVYIYKKPIGNKSYYYLRASEKKGKKLITKDIAYLGSSIDEVKLNLDKLSKYKEQYISWKEARETIASVVGSSATLAFEGKISSNELEGIFRDLGIA